MADHTHEMVQDSETAEQVIFRCTKCKRSLGVWKPDTGRHPQAVAAGKGKWTLPEQDVVSNTFGQLCDSGK